jgi:SET domain-containing protein
VKTETANPPEQTIDEYTDQDQTDPLMEWILIQPSPIHSMGAFARKPIQTGQKIYWDIPVQWMEYSEYQEIIKYLPLKEREFFLTTEDAVYDIRQSILRFINHSHTPNMDWNDGHIIAIKDIYPGEELTINYGWDRYEWDTQE